jgi:hypothetical protein
MREQASKVAAVVENPAFSIRPLYKDGMGVIHVETNEKVDMGPALKGLPGDMCQCSHWGYVVEGAAHLDYGDGMEEVSKAGDLFYWPAPHTGWFEAGTKVIEFSPEAEHKALIKHVTGG